MIESALIGTGGMQRGSGTFRRLSDDTVTPTPKKMYLHGHDEGGGVRASLESEATGIGRGPVGGQAGKGKLTGVFGIVSKVFEGNGDGEVELGSGNTVVALEVYSDGFGFGLNQKTGAMGYFPLANVTFPTTPDSPDGIMVEVEVNHEAAQTLGIE